MIRYVPDSALAVVFPSTAIQRQRRSLSRIHTYKILRYEFDTWAQVREWRLTSHSTHDGSFLKHGLKSTALLLTTRLGTTNRKYTIKLEMVGISDSLPLLTARQASHSRPSWRCRVREAPQCINLYSPTRLSGGKERNIQTYKYGEKATKEKKTEKKTI